VHRHQGNWPLLNDCLPYQPSLVTGMLPKSDIESRSSDTKVSKDGGEMNFSALKIFVTVITPSPFINEFFSFKDFTMCRC
jgi:hypothetical protein